MKISSMTIKNPVGENQFFFDEDNNHSWLDIVPKNIDSKMDGLESERSRKWTVPPTRVTYRDDNNDFGQTSSAFERE